MKTIRHILLSIFLLSLSPCWGQHEIEIDWDTYAQDTVMPVFTHSIDLGYDYTGSYSATIEYPEITPLTTNEVTRLRLPKAEGAPEWPKMDVYKGVSAKRGQLDVSFSPIIWRDGQYWRIQSFVLKIHRDALSQQRRANEEERYVPHSKLANGRWVKIRVTNNGIHMLTHSALAEIGFNNPEKVRLFGYGGHLLSENDITSWRDDIIEVPLWRENDRMVFYANGSVKWTLKSDNTFTHTRNPYSDYGYYFLTEDMEGTPAEIPMSGTLTEQQRDTIKTTPAYALHEVDNYAWIPAGRKLVESYDYADGAMRKYTISTPGADPSKNGKLYVSFTHNAAEATSLSIAAGDSVIGTLRINALDTNCAATFSSSSYTIPINSKSDVQEITLTHNRPYGVSGRLDYLLFNYTRTIGLESPIYATSTGTNTYEVNSVGDNAIVWCISDASSPTCIPSTIKEKKMFFSAKGTKGDVYIAFNPRAPHAIPEIVGEVANQDLHSTEATDYVIIIPANGQYMEQAKRLAEAHRQHRGLRVKIVRADELYNEFSSGTPDATAYRRYMKMLYDRATTVDDAPKYLLLFGDGAWDNRMLTSTWKDKSPNDYLLCYEAENSYSTTSSHVVEDYYGFLDDGEGSNLKRDKVDIGVGRFPVTMVSQADEVVDKIIAYMGNTEAGAWKNTILMLGDDGDNNRHMDDAELVAQMYETEYPDYMVKRIYWDTFPMEKRATGNSYPAVHKRLLELFKEGALMVNYSGHGGADVLSHELVLSRSDMAQTRSPRLPVWVTVSCDITPFDNIVPSFGETAFLNPAGGAIGMLTSTRTTYAEQNRRINYFFSKYMLARNEQNHRLSLGDALRLAKCNLITTEDATLRDVSGNKLNYVLIGDPALIVGNANYHMVVDELNGTPVSESGEVMMKAGSQVTVKGHVEDLGGERATNFTGMLYASVFDNIEEVVCRNNAKADLTPYVYHERTKKFFVGSDSVRNGDFTFSFRVPMDINYSCESGLINLYAVDSTYTQEATGAFDKFLLGGTEENLTNDGSGPSIRAYLNYASFVSGDKVNETPRLMAILEDGDGINTAGGLGHNLMAIIDGKASMTYNLNEYYVSDAGGFTRGTISFLVPELPEGRHTLMLRAWDMMNNSSTTTIEFEVVKGFAPSLVQVVTMPNTTNTSTTFMLTHDRPENEMTVTFEVFDFSGRILWNHSEQVIALDNTYSYTWNHSTSSGRPLDTGVYLYRITVSSPMGLSSSQSQKLFIRR